MFCKSFCKPFCNSKSATALAVLAALATASAAADAAGFNGARNTAMGGTGVSSSHYSEAPLSNPALLTHYGTQDHFSLIIPSIGASVADPDDIGSRADNVQDAWNAYDQSINADVASAQKADVRLSAADLINQLQKFSSVHADAHIGAAVAAAVPNQVLPFAVTVKTQITATVDAHINGADISYLQNVINNGTTPGSATDNLTSRARGRAAAVTEVAISLAHQFNHWSLGITPKYQRVDTFNYNVSVNDYSTSDITDSDYHRTTGGINADLGAAVDLTDNWLAGLVVQNIIPRSVDTASVNHLRETFKIRPQVTVGTSWHNQFVSAALDVDLTPGNSFTRDNKPQFARIGAEFDAWKWMQLRAGYRQSFHGNEGSAFSAGVGISPFDLVHLDITGIAGTDRTYGALAQLLFTF